MRASRTRPGLGLRPACADDCDAVFRWNNDPAIRHLSIDRRPFSRGTHDAWFAAKLADPDHRMWIVEIIGESIGVVRVARPGGGAGVVSIALDRTARGLGLGRAALALACDADGGPLVAEIVVDNRASRTCFEACGFALAHQHRLGDGRVVLTYEWRRAHAIAI